jgi:sugar/nucleoside kinase (ribokinase family)
MSLLVVGSIAFDSVQTPFGQVKEALGGSAVYFSYAASFFTQVRLVGAVGEDFEEDHLTMLKQRGVDTSGVVRMPGKTFRWSGKYEGAMNEAKTLDVQLNVLGQFDGTIPASFADSEYVFLANGSPVLQRRVLDQARTAKLAVADTMNYYIANERDALKDLLRHVDGIVMNDQEVRMYTGECNLPKAGKMLLADGPKFAVIKKGEHGALLVHRKGFFMVPAYPTLCVTDPTGAGDSFAGGMMGYLGSAGSASLTHLKRALLYGTVVASINVEGFSLDRLRKTTREDIDSRFDEFRAMMRI